MFAPLNPTIAHALHVLHEKLFYTLFFYTPKFTSPSLLIECAKFLLWFRTISITTSFINPLSLYFYILSPIKSTIKKLPNHLFLHIIHLILYGFPGCTNWFSTSVPVFVRIFKYVTVYYYKNNLSGKPWIMKWPFLYLFTYFNILSSCPLTTHLIQWLLLYLPANMLD